MTAISQRAHLRRADFVATWSPFSLNVGQLAGRMRIASIIAIALCTCCQVSPIVAQECEAGGNAYPVVAGPPGSSSLEYAKGEPRTVDIEDAGEIKQLPYIKSGSYAIFEGDIVIGDANQIAFAAQSGPIRTLYRTSAGSSEITPFG